MGDRDPKSNPHAYAASTLMAEMSSQPQLASCVIKYIWIAVHKSTQPEGSGKESLTGFQCLVSTGRLPCSISTLLWDPFNSGVTRNHGPKQKTQISTPKSVLYIAKNQERFPSSFLTHIFACLKQSREGVNGQVFVVHGHKCWSGGMKQLKSPVMREFS